MKLLATMTETGSIPALTPNLLIRNAAIRKLQGLSGGSLRVIDTWGEWESGEDNGLKASIEIHEPAFYRQLLLGGSNGVARAYIKGLWSCDDLISLFRLLILNIDQLDGIESGAGKIANFLYLSRHFLNRNSKDGSRDNIHAHYDLGNDLFELFLDETMTYSAGIYKDDTYTLREASVEKLDRICRKIGLHEDMHILETGTGWGSFAVHAAKNYGCRVTTTTISQEQYDYARNRIKQEKLEHRIELVLEDYRDLDGKFDRIVSIEMLEAVGHKYLPVYFNQCSAMLKDEGQMLVQVITMPDHRYEQYLKQSDFIQQFIFPGSCCPSLTAILNAATGQTDLRVSH
ncbi:MAG: cyclopropane-fatty-acyl-phospholipid synthase family protein, partial [Gammaproteobacteria bacterium]|nr:cyclopropane-fatty-acyl-phospholipid synthase family protein [Gammaproteobacteria bacterium]